MIYSLQESQMQRPDPFVLESFEARAVNQDLAALAAYNKGNRTNGDIYANAAAETWQTVKQYEKHGSVGGVR
jgi:hypothetical protein